MRAHVCAYTCWNIIPKHQITCLVVCGHSHALAHYTPIPGQWPLGETERVGGREGALLTAFDFIKQRDVK